MTKYAGPPSACPTTTTGSFTLPAVSSRSRVGPTESRRGHRNHRLNSHTANLQECDRRAGERERRQRYSPLLGGIPRQGVRPCLHVRARQSPTWAVIAILSLCGTVVALQQTMVVPLLPEFPGILGVSSDDASWLVTATLLTSAVATPIMSRLADMFGKRLMMIMSHGGDDGRLGAGRARRPLPHA